MTIQQRLKQAENLCQKHNAKLTPLRKALLCKLYENTKPQTAYELLRLMREQYPKMEAMSVYRILTFLETHHLVHRLNSCQAYAACNMPDTAHHAQLVVCEKCHHSEEIAMPSLAASIDSVLKQHAFCFSNKSFEILGICHNCTI